jgi:hypothetical protein
MEQISLCFAENILVLLKICQYFCKAFIVKKMSLEVWLKYVGVTVLCK